MANVIPAFEDSFAKSLYAAFVISSFCSTTERRVRHIVQASWVHCSLRFQPPAETTPAMSARESMIALKILTFESSVSAGAKTLANVPMFGCTAIAAASSAPSMCFAI